MKNSDKAIGRAAGNLVFDIRNAIGDKQFFKDTQPHHVGNPNPPLQVPRNIPEAIRNFNASFQLQQEATAQYCLRRAEELESLARNLRDMAATLNYQAAQVPADLEDAVKLEEEMRIKCDGLRFVNGGEHDSG